MALLNHYRQNWSNYPNEQQGWTESKSGLTHRKAEKWLTGHSDPREKIGY